MKDILAVFTVIMWLGFAPYVAVRAWRRGYYEWAWGTVFALIVSWVLVAVLFPEAGTAADSVIGILLFLSSPLVSFVAFKKTTEPVAPPAECPECGESGAARGIVTLDQETGEKVSAKLTGTLLLAGGIGCFALSLWFLFVALTWDAPVSMPTNTWGGLAMLIIIGYYIFAAGFKILTQRPANIVQMMKYKCGTCKHAWTQEALL